MGLRGGDQKCEEFLRCEKCCAQLHVSQEILKNTESQKSKLYQLNTVIAE